MLHRTPQSMDSRPKTQSALFQVYLRLRPPLSPTSPGYTERFLTVQEPEGDGLSTQITLNPPNDNRRRAVEKFVFTDIFDEDSSQLDIFHGTQLISLVEGTLGADGGDGRDGLLATLGVSGSGKSHTILGSRSQRGLTQLALDVLFRAIAENNLATEKDNSILTTISASDASEAQVLPAQTFLDAIFNDSSNASRAGSRAQTPVIGDSNFIFTPRKPYPPQCTPQLPDISHITAACDKNAEYAILISMYEVYNDRIFDLLTPASQGKFTKEYRRRPLLYKHTELSPDRKVVAGLRKVLCGTMKEALMVLEAGMYERRVAGTGSNSVSSRSHGFFSVEVKKRMRNRLSGMWQGSSLTIVDLAGSERAREAKTQGATLAEAGKINESLMYLGQCLQMQSYLGNGTRPNLVPFRQCKLTELLFSNSFPTTNTQPMPSPQRNPQKAIMIVTADPLGDFNATSQILRYSALAREITVPRIPSVTSTIQVQTSTPHHSGSMRGWGKVNPGEGDRETMEIAALEIARMSEEIDGLRAELRSETERRLKSETRLETLSSRITEIEAGVREECFQEMEHRMETEIQRWKATWALEADLKDEHLDRKLEIFARTFPTTLNILEDENKENNYSCPKTDLEEENARLRKDIESLKRDLIVRSPSKLPRLPRKEKNTFPLTLGGSNSMSPGARRTPKVSR
ncbi:BgTH12-07284 [Blumeria graminis f. sp. triticale]|uniref:Kinesin-like protein n=1 Tax=Blumeria graminis f. sp. triticale TaxID=1689686 RepID=A0A9W4D8V9_BLUGR|nr:BgTH12-07284 [Blumeria graminis f. sp. triticale]